MKLEKIIDEKEVFHIGIYWTDEEFEDRKNAIMPLIFSSSKLSH